MMKNITHIITSVGYGGGERVVLGLAGYFKEDYMLRIFSLTRSELFHQESLREGIDFVEITKEKLEKLNSAEYLKVLVKSIVKTIGSLKQYKDIDVLHSHGFPDIIISLIVKFFHRNIKIVYTHHTQMAKKNNFSKFIWNFLYKQIDAFTTITQLSKSNILKNFPDKKIIVIGNWVAPYFFQSSSSNLNNQDQNKGLRFLSVGRIEEIKRPDLILEYFIKFLKEGSTLTFIGKGSYEEKLREKIIQHNLQNQVSILEEVQNEKLPDIMKNYDAAMLFGNHEGFCIAAAEAIVMGLPVLTLSDCGAINEISGAACINLDGLINKNDELANKIKTAKNACQIMKNEFSREVTMQKYKYLYEELSK